MVKRERERERKGVVGVTRVIAAKRMTEIESGGRRKGIEVVNFMLVENGPSPDFGYYKEATSGRPPTVVSIIISTHSI